MNQREVCEAFLRGEDADSGPLWSKSDGRAHDRPVQVLRSYGTPIAALVGRWVYLTRSTHSRTTAGHVAKATSATLRSARVDHVVTGDRELVDVLRAAGLSDFGRLA